MKKMNMMKGMAFVAMMVMSMSVMAQRNGGNNAVRGGGIVVTEHGIGHAGNMGPAQVDRRNDTRSVDMRGRNDVGMHGRNDMDMRGRNEGRGRYEMDTRGHMAPPPAHEVHIHGVAPGRGHVVAGPYEGRVRHMADGRWGYLRGNRWYYYDCYYEPEYYFSHPVRHFHRHRVGKVGAAVALGAVVGSIVTGLILH